MPKRWVVGGIWAISMTAGVWACLRPAAAEQPTKPGKIYFPSKAVLVGQLTGPQKIIVSDVIISGNQRMSKEQIKVRLRIQPGSEYEPAIVDDDVRDLYKTGQFSNISTLLQPDGIGRVRIYFAVRELPNMVQKVTFLGAKHIKNEDLLNITGVRPGTPLNPNLNRQGCQKILETYAEMGRSLAECHLIKGGDLADTEVIYQITEGPKVKVRAIIFEGNRFVTAARLSTQLKSTQAQSYPIGGTYTQQTVDATIGDLYQYYRSFGFQDVRVSKEEQRSADGREVTLIFHIQEGPRYRIQEVPEVNNDSDVPREHLIALSSFKPGDYLDEETLKHDIKAITDYMASCGRAVCVDAIPVWIPASPGVIRVRYEVTGPLPRIDKILVSGNKRISDEVILAHVPLQRGKSFTAADLQQAEKNLAELGLFVVDAATGVRPTITVLDSGTEDEYKDLLITLKEKPKVKPQRTDSQE